MSDNHQDINQVLLLEVPLATCACHLQHFSLLSADERIRANRYRTAIRRQSFVAGRTVLRMALGRHLQISPEQVPLALDSNGKPKLEHSAGHRRTNFNLTHSRELLVVGLTEFDGIGVDVEDLDRPINAQVLIRNFFSQTELAEWLQYPAHERKTAFFRGWTRKEAAWKFFGSESNVRWSDIEVSFDNRPHTQVRIASDTYASVLECFSWNPTSTTVASVVIQPSWPLSIEKSVPSTKWQCALRGPSEPERLGRRERDNFPHFKVHGVGFADDRQLIWNESQLSL